MSRLRFGTARQVFDAFPPARDDIEAEPADVEPLAFIDQLLKSPTPEDAIGFCAYLLPRREAVWWACQCIRAVEPATQEVDGKLLAIAEAWVKTPEEENRKAALTAGLALAVKSPAAWAALAAAWSGGSMVEEPNPPVPPPGYLTAQAVRAAILTALAKVNMKERNQYLAESVQRAIKLAGADAHQP
jgi:hypothetical protein